MPLSHPRLSTKTQSLPHLGVGTVHISSIAHKADFSLVGVITRGCHIQYEQGTYDVRRTWSPWKVVLETCGRSIEE